VGSRRPDHAIEQLDADREVEALARFDELTARAPPAASAAACSNAATERSRFDAAVAAGRRSACEPAC
jgi:hypothetical protein